MKKYLIVLAVALVALAGCKPKENGSAITNLSFKQTEISGLAGDTLRLALVVTPAEAPVPEDLVWSSSDEEVVSVVDKKGNIALLAPGTANITAKSGEFSAVCKVTVFTYEEAWAPLTMFYFPSTKSELPVSDTIYEYEYPSGIYKCQLFSVTVCAVNSIEFDETGNGEGTGIIVDSNVPYIVATPAGKEQFLGQMWEYVGIQIVPEDSVNLLQYGVAPGEIDPELIGPAEAGYIQAMKEYALSGGTGERPDWNDFADDYAQGVFGGHLCYVQSTDTSAGWSDIYSGIITAGHLMPAWDAEGHLDYWDYDLTIQWCYGYDGLAVSPDWNSNDPNTWALKTPYELDLSDPYRYVTGQIGTITGAPQRKLAPRMANGQKQQIKMNKGQMKKMEPAKYKVAKLK